MPFPGARRAVFTGAAEQSRSAPAYRSSCGAAGIGAAKVRRPNVVPISGSALHGPLPPASRSRTTGQPAHGGDRCADQGRFARFTAGLPAEADQSGGVLVTSVTGGLIAVAVGVALVIWSRAPVGRRRGRVRGVDARRAPGDAGGLTNLLEPPGPSARASCPPSPRSGRGYPAYRPKGPHLRRDRRQWKRRGRDGRRGEAAHQQEARRCRLRKLRSIS